MVFNKIDKSTINPIMAEIERVRNSNDNVRFHIINDKAHSACLFAETNERMFKVLTIKNNTQSEPKLIKLVHEFELKGKLNKLLAMLPNNFKDNVIDYGIIGLFSVSQGRKMDEIFDAVCQASGVDHFTKSFITNIITIDEFGDYVIDEVSKHINNTKITYDFISEIDGESKIDALLRLGSRGLKLKSFNQNMAKVTVSDYLSDIGYFAMNRTPMYTINDKFELIKIQARIRYLESSYVYKSVQELQGYPYTVDLIGVIRNVIRDGKLSEGVASFDIVGNEYRDKLGKIIFKDGKIDDISCISYIDEMFVTSILYDIICSDQDTCVEFTHAGFIKFIGVV